jgi:Ni/Co efflux regulator RcnB
MKKLITAALAAALLVSGAATSASAANWNNNHDNHNNNYGHQQMKHHGWKNGGYLPAQYRHNREVDWRSHHLRQPPRGYHWVQTDGDYVLVALTTGLIMQAIANAN